MTRVIRDAADFDEQLANAEDMLVIVDFFATWCGPCKIVAPTLEEFADQYRERVVILKVDVDECEDLAMRYKIVSMPTFVYIKNRNQVDILSGANCEKLKELIIKHTS